MQRIVIVEDDLWMREELEEIFIKAGYEALSIGEFTDPVSEIQKMEPDLVLLDLNLPGMNGMEICRRLKKREGFPILILTSRDRMKDELDALGFGADEYLTKPCHRERLLARTENLLRRYEGKNHIIEIDAKIASYDCRSRVISCRGESVFLSENQGRLLEVLLKHAGEAVSRDVLSAILWGTVEFIDENALQVNLTRLKKTLKTVGLDDRIETVRGRGYRWKIKEAEC